MEPLWKNWPQFAKRIGEKKSKLFLFDIDGTLAALAPTPGQACVNDSTRTLLKKLSHTRGSHVGVLSGRSLEKTKRMVKVPGLTFGGNHGLEIEGPAMKFVHPGATRKKRLIRDLADWLGRTLPRVPGRLIEYKGLAMAIHTRRLRPKDKRVYERHLKAVIEPLSRRLGLRMTYGKEVFEIRPDVNWDKGSAVSYIRQHSRPSATIVYVGDDATDEDAFGALHSSDIGIRIGAFSRSRASYYLRGQDQVENLLKRIVYELA